MNSRQRVLAWTSIVVIVAGSTLVSSAGTQPVYSANNGNGPGPSLQLSSVAAGKLLGPLNHPEGDNKCASDLTNPQIFYEDTEKYSEVFPGFTDVARHASYCTAIRYLVMVGAVNGYSDNTFRPYNVVTRGQFSKMLIKTFYNVYLNPSTPTYADVPTTSPFYQYVETASANDLVTGYSGDPNFINRCVNPNGEPEILGLRYFRPCLNITRGQMAKPLSQAAHFREDVTGRSTFWDISSSYYHYVFIERLAMRIAVDEIPFDTPSRPICLSTIKPCYRPNVDVLRNDAAQLIYLALAYGDPNWSQRSSQAGRAFPRRYRVVNNGQDGGYDGVQGFVSTPYNNPPGGGHKIAGPLVVGDAVNVHFIESGPIRDCSAASTFDDPNAPDVCVNYPYGSSGTSRACEYDPVPCRDEYFEATTILLASGQSYEYRSYYAGNNEWWAEFYHPGLQYWRRLITVTEMGTTALREVNGAAESTDLYSASGNIRYTNVRAHTPGGSWSGWCPDRAVYQRMMFGSYVSSCPPPNAEPFSWDVGYVPPAP